MKKTLAALAGALVALPVLAAGPQGFAAAPQAQGPNERSRIFFNGI